MHHEGHFCEIILNLNQCFRCHLKIFFWSFGSPFVQRSRTISAILVEDIMRNISVKFLEFGPVVQEMLFKRFSYQELWQPA